MRNVIIILGPTASGKTTLSINLAKDLNTEIISADSMQIYKYMEIGTAKPSRAEMSGIPHHVMDEITPDQSFSVAQYKERAVQCIDEILGRNKIPIIVGGTGLYLNALLYNIEFSETICDWELREKLNQEALKNGNEHIHRRLSEVDPQAANKLHVNDTKRIIRALEVYESTGKTISYHQEISRQNPSRYNFILIGLMLKRDVLYERINLRVDKMIQYGLVDEVKKLCELGYDKNKIAMQAIGYKEIIKHLNGEFSKDQAIELIKRESRRYAKRQITWFKRLLDITWIDVDCLENWEILKKTKDILATMKII